MRRKVFLTALVAVIAFSVSGCFSVPTRKAVLVPVATGAGQEGPQIGVYTQLPSPRAGLVIITSRNQHHRADCVLFGGSISQREMFAADIQTGLPVLARQPLMRFALGPTYSRNEIAAKALQLATARSSYTLLVYWKTITGRVVDVRIHGFSTRGYPYNYRDLRGIFTQRVFADTFVDLAGPSRSYQTRQLRIREEIPLGQIVAEGVGTM